MDHEKMKNTMLTNFGTDGLKNIGSLWANSNQNQAAGDC